VDEAEGCFLPVAELARGCDATVRLLQAVPPAEKVRDADDRLVVWVNQETTRVEQETRYLKRAAAGLEGVAVETAVRIGDVTTEIVEEAEAAGADLIALAVHERRGLSRVLRGGLVRRFRKETTIPLLLVPRDGVAAA
jgi:nucleotide-binding universal stress UspA family protein